MSKKNEERAELLAGAYQRQYHHNDYPELSNNSEFVTSKEEIKEACMVMAIWKDSQCLGTLLRVFDLIANKRDAGEAFCSVPQPCRRNHGAECGQTEGYQQRKPG